jgi:hypothetical protein
LSAGVDGLFFSSVCILMHDSNDWSSLSDNDTATGNDRYVNDMMIVNASNVNMSTGLEDDAYVVSSDTPIGALISKCSGFARPVSRNGVADGYVHRAVLLAMIDNDKFCIS